MNDWRQGGDPGALEEQARLAWQRAGMGSGTGDDLSAFCAMLARIADFLRAAEVIQESCPSLYLEDTMWRLSQATWRLGVPSPLLEPDEIVEVERILNDDVIRSVETITLAATNARKSAVKGWTKGRAQIEAVESLRGAIHEDRDAVVSPLRRYRLRLGEVRSVAKAQDSRSSRAAKLMKSRSAPSKNVPASTSMRPSTSREARRKELASFASGYDPLDSRVASHVRDEEVSGRGYEADITSRIGSLVTASSGFDSYSGGAIGIESEARNYPRLAFGFGSRGGRDMFSEPSIPVENVFSEPVRMAERFGENVYAQSSFDTREAGARIRH
ncbi:hypothetical protein [Robbsia sp. KACC 23696]|uniref:hypothetical protein n=1 Tax=Robbsia sp. KACC 23696 TaxID=3149231 RepID=UPI00325AD934